MEPVLAAAAGPQAAVLVAAALAAALALGLEDPRPRATAMLAALLLAVAGVALLHPHTGGIRPALLLAAAAAALLLVAALVALLVRRPAAFAILAFLALPFRVPITIGADTANLLVPLYVVIAAGALAHAWAAARAPASTVRAPGDPRYRQLRLALGGVLVLYALQSLYSDDLEQAVKNACFFYVPFAVLVPLLGAVAWSRRLVVACAALVAGLAVVFAGVAFVEFATGRLVIPNAKVLDGNDLKPYFRVNSLFFDPNIYGRFLALTMIAACPVLLWSRRPRTIAAAAVLLAVLWAGLVVSLSQSSFAALLAGLAVVAACRWRAVPVLLGVGLALVAAAAVVLGAPHAIGLSTDVNRASSGRADLVTGGVSMFTDRPVEGFGSGSFAERYRAREHIGSKRTVAVSHTIPVTVAAEQGAIGLLAYLALLLLAFRLLLGGLREGLRSETPGAAVLARLAVAAAFAGLVLHTFLYAAFLEDPLAWALLGLSAALAPAAIDRKF